MIKRLVSTLTRHQIRYFGPSGDRRLYLTFDDGPHPTHTSPLLDLLARHEVKATFFVVGREAFVHPGLVRRIVQDGHSLGNHSITHPRMDFLTDAARDSEIEGMEGFLDEFEPRPVRHFRPPYGRVSLSLFSYAIRSGRHLAMWSRDSLDYKSKGDDVVDRFCARPPRPGDILLFHDDGAVAMSALQTLLPVWLDQGFTFGTFDDIPLTAGVRAVRR